MHGKRLFIILSKFYSTSKHRDHLKWHCLAWKQIKLFLIYGVICLNGVLCSNVYQSENNVFQMPNPLHNLSEISLDCLSSAIRGRQVLNIYDIPTLWPFNISASNDENMHYHFLLESHMFFGLDDKIKFAVHHQRVTRNTPLHWYGPADLL